MRAKQIVLSRLLPKTGQQETYIAEDDGFYEIGWWRGLLNVGNYERFLIKTISGDEVVVDRATGLMWARDGEAAGCNNGTGLTWELAIDYGVILGFAGFNDWRLPNLNELISIVNFAKTAPITWSAFTNTKQDRYWSSTTRFGSTTKAGYVKFSTTITIGSYNKTSIQKLRCVRGGR